MPLLALLAAVVLTVPQGCGRRMEPLTVGSTAATDRAIIAEVTAQLLEKQLGMEVIRKYEIGGTQIAYESLMLGTINIYPEETNAIVVSVLKEPVDPNPDIVYERVRSEMERIARIQVFKSLGVNERPVMVIRATDQKDGGIRTLSDAAQSKLAWTLANTTDFQSRSDGYAALMSTYNLPLKVAPRVMLQPALYPALAENQVSMISGHDTDGPLGGEGFAILKDDKEAFRQAAMCLLGTQEAIARDPRIRPALESLSGKFSNDSIRKAAYKVAVMKRNLKDVATEVLREIGL